jgi:filamentous hemagglutinin
LTKNSGLNFGRKQEKSLGKPGSGVFEQQVGDQTYRFRIDNNSLEGNHAPYVPHVHVEILDQNGNILVNNHISYED